MRRLLPPMAMVAALIAAPAAHADDIYFDLTEGARGSVRSVTAQPAELRLERGGATIRTDGPGTENEIGVTPRPGDVVRVFQNGAEVGSVPFDGRPTIDDSCSRVGTTTIGGSWEPADQGGGGISAILDGGGNGVTGTGTRGGGRYTITFPRAIDRDDRIQVSSVDNRSLAGGGRLGVFVDRNQRICPVVVPAKAVLSGPARQGKRRVRRDRRVTLPKLELACPGPGEACDVDVRILSPKLGVLAVTRYKLPATARRAVRARLFRFAMRRLKRRKRTNVKVTVNVRRSPAATVTKTVRLRLLAPRPRRR